MAEGFIIQRGQERIKDVAEGYLDELIRRSLVQLVDTFWEKVIKCKIHDLLRDLAIQKALEKNLKSSSCIRHAIHSEGERYLSPLDHLSNSKLREFVPPQVVKLERCP
uniref:Disease resistance protein winged helix domain-containing protein n=1 Tax=Solanum lycopersicum TaxID=4081 RepID=A0A3Q7I4Y1_SOLLC